MKVQENLVRDKDKSELIGYFDFGKQLSYVN